MPPIEQRSLSDYSVLLDLSPQEGPS